MLPIALDVRTSQYGSSIIIWLEQQVSWKGIKVGYGVVVEFPRIRRPPAQIKKRDFNADFSTDLASICREILLQREGKPLTAESRVKKSARVNLEAQAYVIGLVAVDINYQRPDTYG